MAKETARREPEGANEDVAEGPEFVQLCDSCEAKLRAMSKAKIRLAAIAGFEGDVVGNLIVPKDDVPLILDVASHELEEAIGMAYLESKGA